MEFYDSFQDSVPDAYSVDYVFSARYIDFATPAKRKIEVMVPLRGDSLLFSGYAVDTYGMMLELPASAILVDKAFALLHPIVLRGAKLEAPAAKRTR
jgi:hypothetical protein